MILSVRSQEDTNSRLSYLEKFGPLLVDKAREWLDSWRSQGQVPEPAFMNYMTFEFIPPEEDEYVCLELFCEERKLTVYVEADNIQYIACWGPNIITQMVDGKISSPRDQQALFQWMVSGEVPEVWP